MSQRKIQFAPQFLCSKELLARVTFTCIGSTFSYPHKVVFIPRPPRTLTHSSAGSLSVPQVR